MSSFVLVSVGSVQGHSYAGDKDLNVNLTTFVGEPGSAHIVADSDASLTLKEAEELLEKLQEEIKALKG